MVEWIRLHPVLFCVICLGGWAFCAILASVMEDFEDV